MSQQFFYKAMDSHGHIVQGQISANNINDLEIRLDRMGLDLIHCRTQRLRNLRLGRVTRQDLITFCFHMENLTRSGVPLLEGLGDLRDTLPQSRFREIISSLIESIQGGSHLSEAMAEFPETFNQVFVSLIHTGEESGTLSRVFQHLTETLKWHDEMVAKTKKLLMYPSFMGIVLLGVLFFIMMFLVPQLITFFKNLNVELPLQTRVLLFISNLFVNYWYIILMIPVLIVVSLKVAVKVSPQIHWLIDYFKLRVWIIGPILEKIILARFATFFALLYSAGITILDSLQISKGLVGNVVIEKALQEVIDHIADGVSITESFDRVNLFPPLVLRMVRVGESTGELDIALSNVSYFYNREVKESIDKLQTLIEPAMVVVLGVLLGWVILSFFLPLYDVMIDITNEVGSQNKASR
jgi:type IV pilus assembly protein PilC